MEFSSWVTSFKVLAILFLKNDIFPKTIKHESNVKGLDVPVEFLDGTDFFYLQGNYIYIHKLIKQSKFKNMVPAANNLANLRPFYDFLRPKFVKFKT